MSQIHMSTHYPGATAELLHDNGDATARVRLIDVDDRYWEGPGSGAEHTVELAQWAE
ncbi:hypothetical protein [Saccharothrix sp. Mg75]|uniref:hypothetical protein n=1 Tax=Saccharothrix sp. Mg75 TaxID=3445357 RepID=UPI003EEC3A38